MPDVTVRAITPRASTDTAPVRRNLAIMVGRHRKPPAWRRLLTSLLRSQRTGRMAALQAEVAALRATVGDLRHQLDLARAELAEPHAVADPAPAPLAETVPAAPVAEELRWLTLQLPLVRAAFAQEVVPEPAFGAVASLDLGADTASTRIVLPESALLDPRIDRAAELAESLGDGAEEKADADGAAPGQAVA
jgi:hypothetical protein